MPMLTVAAWQYARVILQVINFDDLKKKNCTHYFITQISEENKMLLTQAPGPVYRLLETFWTFTSLVVL